AAVVVHQFALDGCDVQRWRDAEEGVEVFEWDRGDVCGDDGAQDLYVGGDGLAQADPFEVCVEVDGFVLCFFLHVSFSLARKSGITRAILGARPSGRLRRSRLQSCKRSPAFAGMTSKNKVSLVRGTSELALQEIHRRGVGLHPRGMTQEAV